MNKPQPAMLSDLVRAVGRIAPPHLAEPWDNVGLQVGDPSARIERVMTCLEITPPTLAEARARKAGAIVAHHPLIFKPLNALHLGQPTGKLLAGLVESGIGLVAAHTNLDSAVWGTNRVLAEACGLEPTGPFDPQPVEPLFKLAVFVPAGHEAALIEAIHRGGGGQIGAYSRCTFRSPGTGTFCGGEGSDPFIGEAGRLEQAEETRMEAVVPESARAAVLREVIKAHPYEEVAYDLYRIEPTERPAGLGLLAKPAAPTTARELAEALKARLKPALVRLSGPAKKKVRTVALCSGAGGSQIGRAAARADVLVTGEINYHHAVEAHARGLAVIELGHFETEAMVAGPLAERLAADARLAEAGVEVFAAKKDLQPFEVI